MADRSALVSQIDAEIARLSREIGLLRAAADVLRGTEAKDDRTEEFLQQPTIQETSSPKGPGEFTGSTIEEVASAVLAEHKDGLTSNAVAEIAMKRGYRSTSPRNPTSDPVKIRQSFRVTMRRHPDRFQMDGKKFKAKS